MKSIIYVILYNIVKNTPPAYRQTSRTKMEKKISYEYIRGLIEGEGSFVFTSNSRKNALGEIKKIKIPTFVIGMHERDEPLLCLARDRMGLGNRVYNYKSSNRDGYNRGRKAFLIVREIGSLKNIVVPFFYDHLIGFKGVQFNKWLDDIGLDPDVPESYKIIYRLHGNGYYKKNPKFL